ncbi:polysaccharide biosynthesis protein [Chloroherpeton thalassium ATCC 35110]|uniref:Polysaccharide biosynthesis protein n=1 Tax=Chloroherpeton thalassium (strain ATCC 35110 / GB-78) TaxID=517418 RepID=B3QUX0_CHLT3|nr:oligosaccharide flippase family protein [Chloroherpeton thalassium]ACF14471.1 polysaccharide biosynthesis protein [Chloroherpeton thalassium ATCC 35110]
MIARLKAVLDRFGLNTRLSHDAIRVYLFQFLGIAASFVLSILIARILGPAEKGRYDLFLLLNSLMISFGVAGVPNGLLYYMTNEKKRLGEVHGTGLATTGFAWLILFIIGFVWIAKFTALLNGLPEWCIWLSLFIAPALLYRQIWINLMTGANEAVQMHRFQFYIILLNLFGGMYLVWAGELDFSHTIWLTAGIQVFGAIMMVAVLLMKDAKLSIDLSLARKSLSYGTFIFIASLANILHFKVDQIMINGWLGTKSLGMYAVGTKIAEMLFIIDTGLTSTATYKISSSSVQESYRLAVKLFRVQFALSGLSGLFLALIAYPLISAVYGEAYREAALPLIYLIPGIVFWSSSKILSIMLNYKLGMAKFVMVFSMIGGLVNVVLNYVFIVIFDLNISGAALASSISYAIVALITFLKVYQLRK